MLQTSQLTLHYGGSQILYGIDFEVRVQCPCAVAWGSELVRGISPFLAMGGDFDWGFEHGNERGIGKLLLGGG